MAMSEQHVHFIGIGGYGMSAIARVMLEMGYRVSGSDVAQQELTEMLARRGAKVFIGHDAEHVRGADLVVYTSAISSGKVEKAAAESLNIPVIHRSQMLARLLNAKKGIAVAGAHGKTTTTSMIALVLEHAGLDPTYIIGGELLNVGSNAKAGKGDFVVAEADESDGSFLQYQPQIAVVTNIEADHLENYDGDFGKLKEAYVRFLSQVKEGGKAVVCLDDPELSALLPSATGDFITYGTHPDAQYRATDIVLGDRRAEFTVLSHGVPLGRVTIHVPGRHNVLNALAALIVAMEAGVAFDKAAEALAEFSGAKRRFQVLGDAGGILVIDDYAHHPTEIIATIAAAKATGKRIVAVFQPQRYTRTFYLLDSFSRAFGEADEVIIVDIYSPAGEERIEGVSAARLADLIRERSNPNVTHISTKEEVLAKLERESRPGDLVLTMGAGDIWQVAKRFAQTLKERQG